MERPYSVLTIDQVKEKMMKQIDEISNIFWLSKSVVTVLLMNLNWNSLRVSERLSEDKEKLLIDSGLKSVSIDWNQDSSCGNCDIMIDDDDDDEFISTTCCSHKFCITCWRDYLDKNFYSLEQNQTVMISCPKRDCSAAVGPDVIEKLTVRDQEIYEKYVLRCYLQALMIKLCPGLSCKYAIELHDESCLDVVCLCGHTFCWRCNLESHKPVTCNNAALWLSSELRELQDLAEPSNLSWMESCTKPCPKCSSRVPLPSEKHRNFLTCKTANCSFSFCSKCSVEEKLHREKSGLYGACAVPEEVTRSESVTTCVERWEAEQISTEEAKLDLQAFDAYIFVNPCILKEQDIRIVREGYMLIIQCKQVLKWSCAYEHFHTEYEISKKEYLLFLQEIAGIALQKYSKTLAEEKELAIESYEKVCHFRYMVTTATSNIGNFFYHFVKALQNGLVEVKVKSYNNEAGPYWFCDRCTYGNSWIYRECKMCCDSTISPMEDQLGDLSLDQVS